MPDATPDAASNATFPCEHDIIPETNNTAAQSHIRSNEVMQAEIDRLRMQREIYILRQEISDLSRPNQIPVVRLDINAIETMICKFTGDDQYDIRKWLHDLEDAFHVLQFDERAKLVSCRRLLDGTAKIFLRTISVSSYFALKQSVIEEFGRTYTLRYVYQQLKNTV